MNIIAVYDDTCRKSEVITDIIGDKGFGDVVVKKKRLEDYYQSEVRKIYPRVLWRRVTGVSGYADLLKELELWRGTDTRVMLCFSNFLITDGSLAGLSFRKLAYIDEDYCAAAGQKAAAAMFPSADSFMAFCKSVLSGQPAWELTRGMKESFEIEGLVDIGVVDHFIRCITGNFDSRYFNSLQGNEYIIVKSSANKQKIRAEYSFYHLLPEDMKYWFVMPFRYQEEGDRASYSMERLHMTDLAIKWVHGSMDEKEFSELMDKYFFFFRSRHSRECSEESWRRTADSLYIRKVTDRIGELKQLPEYSRIEAYLRAAADTDLDLLADRYFALKQKIESRVQYPCRAVIGHGDPCFANALYNKTTRTLKFIDPKGAVTEEQLWTDPYYDIAKLSHSVCGRYDFFNNALYDIKVSPDFSYDLEIPFDNSRYVEIFRQKLEENGFDYLTVRIYEASLFLSMLPLHIDNPHKVFGFILNVKNILREIEDSL